MSIRSLKIGASVVWLLASLMSVPVSAQEHDAYTLVDETTAQVMDVVVDAKAYADADPERYYSQIQGLLDPLIDYRGFARKVMGPYASSDRYRSLDEAGRQQLVDQLDQFTAVMRGSLVRTYSKGLLAFGGSRIELEPPEDDAASSSRLSLRQLIYADRRDPYVVMYQMGKEKSGEWKLNNVIIESVNLGEVYRDQFLASAREQDGDLDAVIANWTTVVVDVDE
ncbi:MAG: ABC transporter substrate-binding protein [Halioglobus sp.]|jgi:phospholipid transport system substrate-binding protein|nr:ABC transporter substrate-binding protein [Halioglobus sp.]